METNVSQATILAGILISNIAALVGFFVSMKVAIAKLEVKVERLEKDVNNLGNLYRSSNENQTQEETQA